jgi:hypothetical protein
MDFWVTLWTVLLWASTIAFGLVSLYIVAGAVKKLFAAGKE